MIRNNPNLIGNRKVELLDDKIIYHTQNIKSEYNLSAFQRFEEEKSYYYLYLSNDVAFSLPKKQFSDIEIIRKLRSIVPKY